MQTECNEGWMLLCLLKAKVDVLAGQNFELPSLNRAHATRLHFFVEVQKAVAYHIASKKEARNHSLRLARYLSSSRLLYVKRHFHSSSHQLAWQLDSRVSPHEQLYGRKLLCVQAPRASSSEEGLLSLKAASPSFTPGPTDGYAPSYCSRCRHFPGGLLLCLEALFPS